MLLILIGLNLLVSILGTILLFRQHTPLRRAHSARHIADESIALAERSNLQGLPKLSIAVDYCEQEGKRARVKMTRHQWAKLVEIRLYQTKKLANSK